MNAFAKAEAVDPEAISAERQRMRLEQLLTVSGRLIEAVAADIAALEQGEFGQLRTTDPEIERLCAFYGREVRALKAQGGVKRAPAALLAAMRKSGAQLDRLLKHHAHLVGAMREASEGLMKAVAEGVEKIRTADAPYTPVSKAKQASSSGAIVYNKVVWALHYGARNARGKLSIRFRLGRRPRSNARIATERPMPRLAVGKRHRRAARCAGKDSRCGPAVR